MTLLILQLCSLLGEAQLGMHAWQPGAVAASTAAAGKQRRTAEEAAERRRKLVASFCAKGPVYENCRMLSMDGAPLSFIDLRKLQWYEVRFRHSSRDCRTACSTHSAGRL